MPSDTLTSLAMCTQILQGARQNWWLIGGAAFLAHGVGSEALKDIDVLVGSQDAQTLLKRSQMTALKRGGSMRFRSTHFFALTLCPVPVEFMAGLEVCKDGYWHPVIPKTRVLKHIADIGVYVPEAEELARIATLFARPKDLARARRLITP